MGPLERPGEIAAALVELVGQQRPGTRRRPVG